MIAGNNYRMDIEERNAEDFENWLLLFHILSSFFRLIWMIQYLSYMNLSIYFENQFKNE